MANLTAEQYDILQEMLKVITEARQISERLSESWAKGLANPIGPHTTHLSSPITPMTPSQSPQPPDPPDMLLVDPEPLVETMKNSGPFIESLKSASVLQVPDSFCDVLLVHKVDSHVKEVEESPQQPTNSDDKNVAHQVFAQMPLGVTSKEKQRKSLKAWKFKFKTSFKRSKSMDVKFFSVEEIAWFTRDSKEINWGCVNKEFKEAVAGCGKKIINRFKMVDETSKPAAYDGTFQIRVWDCGGSLLECVWWRRLKHCQRYCHEMQTIEAENKSPETLGDHPFAPMKPCQSYAQPCLKCGAEMTIPLAKETQNWMVTAWFKIQVFSDFDIASWIGLKIYGCEYKNHMLLLGYRGLEVQVLSSLQEFGEGSTTDTRIMLCWKKLASFLWFLHGKKLLDGGQKMQSMLVSDFKTWVPHFGYELCLAGTDHVLGLVWSSFENDMNRLWRGPEAVLSFNSEKMGLDWFFQRDLHKSCLDIRRMITLLCSSADYRKLNLWVDTNYYEIRPDKTHVKLQEMSCFLSEKSLVEFVGYKAHGRELLVMVVKQLTLAATKFHLKHKWRSRLLQSFSELKQRIIVSLWKSLGYLMEAHGSKYEGLVCVLEKKKLRNVKPAGCLCDLDQVNSLDEEECVGFTEFSKLRSSRDYLLMNFGIFMNPQPRHDKRITRALLVGLVGNEERLSNRLSLANYVWKPGELLCVQDQWDWISEVHSSGGVLKITQRLRGMRLQGFTNMDKKLEKVLLDNVLRAMVCWSVHNRMCEVEMKIYISANQNSRNQELLITYRFLMIGKFSRSKRLNETCCSLLEVYFEEFVGFNAHENETQSTNQSHGTEGSKRDIQGLENGYKIIVLKLKLPLSSGADWEQLFKWVGIHFSDNQRQEGLLSFPWELMLANLKENHACGVDTRCLEPDRYEFIWWVSRTCEADHISSETFSVGAVHGFFTGSKLQTGDETQEKRLLFLNNNNKVDPTVKENWFYNEPMIRGVFHLQRPPELFDLHGNLGFITKVLVQWKEHPPDQLFSGFCRQVLMLSSLRTRMF